MEQVVSHQEINSADKNNRKQLVPKWIKAFGWLFLIMGAAVPVLLISSIVFDFSARYLIFGLRYEGPALAFMPIAISALILINSVCAFGLLFGKDWGLKACLVYGYIGLAISVTTTIVTISSGGSTFNLDPLIQIPYLYKLHKIRKNW